jgi:hypothetical protein
LAGQGAYQCNALTLASGERIWISWEQFPYPVTSTSLSNNGWNFPEGHSPGAGAICDISIHCQMREKPDLLWKISKSALLYRLMGDICATNSNASSVARQHSENDIEQCGFPEPEGPSTAWHSPSFTIKSIFEDESYRLPR